MDASRLQTQHDEHDALEPIARLIVEHVEEFLAIKTPSK
jgi:hypothetical protein